VLFRLLDRTGFVPPTLRQGGLHELFHLDATCAEALWALDQPPGAVDAPSMLADTIEVLDALPARRDAFVRSLPASTVTRMEEYRPLVQAVTDIAEVYADVPGRGPENG
jgi:hypothetical protein